MQTPEPVMRERLRQRRGDVSDADERVLDAQLARDVGEVAWTRMNPDQPGGTSWNGGEAQAAKA